MYFTTYYHSVIFGCNWLNRFRDMARYAKIAFSSPKQPISDWLFGRPNHSAHIFQDILLPHQIWLPSVERFMRYCKLCKKCIFSPKRPVFDWRLGLPNHSEYLYRHLLSPNQIWLQSVKRSMRYCDLCIKKKVNWHSKRPIADWPFALPNH